jgi:hydrogenase nickel incorporation protein HypA/HybF
VHELSIAEGMVEAILERTGDARVSRVFVAIGKLSCVEPEAIRFCFELCARGTAVDGALLEISEVSGRASCGACGAQEFEVDGAAPLCSCGSADLRIVAGDRMLLTAVETA